MHDACPGDMQAFRLPKLPEECTAAVLISVCFDSRQE